MGTRPGRDAAELVAELRHARDERGVRGPLFVGRRREWPSLCWSPCVSDPGRAGLEWPAGCRTGSFCDRKRLEE